MTTKIWDKILREIRSKVTAENYSTYFRPLVFAGINAQTCTLQVNDAFFGDWVRAHYTDLLTSVISDVAGTSITVVIETIETADKIATPRTHTSVEPSAGTSIDPSPTDAFPTNPDYLFERFVVGPSNELAYAAFQAAAKKPGTLYNPLFLYGPTGLGKTHLLLALGQTIRERDPSARIVYISAEEFTNQVVRHIRTRTMDQFRERFRHQCDVLLIDDIHVLEGKERTQQEFFHTFNALHQMRKQIVLTSDRNPEDMGGLEARLRSRFQWGLICDIQAPALETRVAILQSKATRDGIELPQDVAFYVAEQISQNVRQLEGALVRLCAYANLRKQSLTKTFAETVLRASARTKEVTPSIDRIIDMVAAQYGVDIHDLTGKRRLRKFAHPRSLAMYLCRKYTQASFPMIGQSFGGKDHSTVVAACKKVEKASLDNPNLAQEISALEEKLPALKSRQR